MRAHVSCEYGCVSVHARERGVDAHLADVTRVSLLFEQENLRVSVDIHCSSRGCVWPEAVDELERPPVGHVANHRHLPDAFTHLRRNLQPRRLSHVAGCRHRDRRAGGGPVLLQEGV